MLNRKQNEINKVIIFCDHIVEKRDSHRSVNVFILIFERMTERKVKMM